MKRKAEILLQQFRARQRQPLAVPTVEETQRACVHCGYSFEGRYCPMCGMPGEWTRFTWRRLLLGVLDIWGMGNRPMFRSMGHLLWRPGYMIRDYLGGHYLSYFPPFKMLAILTVLVALVIWSLGIEEPAARSFADPDNPLSYYAVVRAFEKIRAFFQGNPLYRLLIQITLLVFATWIVFRRQSLNFIETFFSLVYIGCQVQMVTIVWLLLTRTYPRTIFPFALPETLVIILLVIDFNQLYGLGFWKTLWRVLLICLLLAMLFATLLLFILLILFVAIGLEKLT